MGKNLLKKLATWGYNTCTQALSRYANLTADDNANSKVPDTFPGTIGLVNNDDGTIVLNPKYRTDTNEFHYYITSERCFSTYNCFNRNHIFPREFIANLNLLHHRIATHILKHLLPLLLTVFFSVRHQHASNYDLAEFHCSLLNYFIYMVILCATK